jgi:hypothetical protein
LTFEVSCAGAGKLDLLLDLPPLQYRPWVITRCNVIRTGRTRLRGDGHWILKHSPIMFIHHAVASLDSTDLGRADLSRSRLAQPIQLGPSNTWSVRMATFCTMRCECRHFHGSHAILVLRATQVIEDAGRLGLPLQGVFGVSWGIVLQICLINIVQYNMVVFSYSISAVVLSSM